MAIIRECDKIDVGVRERGGKWSVEEMRYKKAHREALRELSQHVTYERKDVRRNAKNKL